MMNSSPVVTIRILFEYSLSFLLRVCIRDACSTFILLSNLTNPGGLHRTGEPEHMEIIARGKKGLYSSL